MDIFSIIDVETTGMSFYRNDRIVEIGIVKIDEKGNFIDGFETLLSPGKDAGPTHIHGITNEMISDAPVFSEIAYDLFDFIEGTYPAAHNADFDFGFINSELSRLGIEPMEKGFCTLKIARKLLPHLYSRSLESLTKHFNIKNELKHSAYSDAFATASLLKIFIDQYGWKIDPQKFIQVINPFKNLPGFSYSGKRYKRSECKYCYDL